VYSCTGVLLYTAKGIVCTVVLVYCYIQHRELCVQLYWCTVIYSTENCVYSCTGVLLYTVQGIVNSCISLLLCTAQVCVYRCTDILLYAAQGIVCTAVLVYCYIQHKELYLQLYW